MKAAIHTRYGSPEVVALKDITKPIPQAKELLIKVCASTVNRTDAGFRSATYFISRFWTGLFWPKQHTLGSEFAGIIEDVGKDVLLFKKGDKVFGFDDATFGGHAEYMVIDESKAIATIPDKISIHHAAAIAEGAHYALCNIRASHIQRNQYAMVYGATGAIGSAAVQLLKHYGVNVTAVCNTKNVALVKSLGADQVIDYETQDFKSTGQTFDFIFDAVGKSSFRVCKPLLKDKGIYVSTELGKNAENIFLALFTPMMRNKKVIFPIPPIDKKDLQFLKELIENGDFMPVIDREYQLEQIVEAYEYVESGQKTGNVILRIAEE